MNIASIVRELLLHREKSVIPGFGTFTIIHRPAELNKATGVLLPPSREVRFDNSEQSDDGQLTGIITRRHKLEKAEAGELVAGFVRSLEHELAAKGTVALEGMGNISRNQTGQLIFKPLEELLSRANLFELPRMDVPVTRPVPKPMAPGKASPPPVPVPAVKRRKLWIPAALVVLLAGSSALVYFTGLLDSFKTENTTVSLASHDTAKNNRIVFGNRDTTGTDTLQERVSRELDKRTAREKALLYEETESKPAEIRENLNNEPSQAPATLSEKPFHIIAGSFLVPNNAERQKSKLEGKGFPALLLPKQGDYFMVSLGSYDSREQAVAAMRQLRKKLEQELWVMKI